MNINFKNRNMLLGILTLVFIIITLLVVNNNSLVINLDNAVHSWIANNQFPSIYQAMLSITKIGDVLNVIIIFMVFGLFLFLKNKKSFYIFALSTISGIILTEVIKHVIQRIRPYNLLESGFSFPSSHAMIATVFLFSSIFLLVPLMKRPLFKNLFLFIVSVVFPLVAFSRVYLSVHFTSDVIAGIILGSICFMFAELLCCHKKENML